MLSRFTLWSLLNAVLASLLMMLIADQLSASEASKEITGYGPFDFARTATPGEVEEAGGSRLQAIAAGQLYSFEPYERFEGLVDFLQYHKKGKIPPARQSGSVPRISAAEVRLKDGKLWLIILYFNPNDYEEYLRVIKLEYGEPTVSSKKKKGVPRKDLWLKGGRCITLEQVMLSNAMNGGQLEIQKDRCEEKTKRK